MVEPDESVGDARSRREREDKAIALAVTQARHDERVKMTLEDHGTRVTRLESAVATLTDTGDAIKEQLVKLVAAAQAKDAAAARTVTNRGLAITAAMFLVALAGLLLGFHGGTG